MGGRSILRSILPSGLLRSIGGSDCRGCCLGGYASGCGGRYCRRITHLPTPLHNPGSLPEDGLTEIEIIDPTHPLFGHRFMLRSSQPQGPTAEYVFVAYREHMVLRIPRAATTLVPHVPQVSTTLTSQAITELISLAEQCEVLCRTTPTPSGTPSRPTAKPPSAPSSQPSSRR